jgi:hypothetical protein
MFRKGMVVLLIGGLGLLISVSANAQEWGFNPGDWEFTLQGSGTSDHDVDNTTASVEGSIGYFFTDWLELGLRQGVGYVDIEGGDDNWNASTRGFLDFHFDLGRVQPFLGVNFGYLYGDEVNETFIAGPEGGLKVFLTNSAFLYGLAEYNFTFEDADDADDAFDEGRFVYALGLGIRW